MTLLRNKAALLGLTNGAAITPGSSGGGGQDAFDEVALSGSATVTYEASTGSMVCADPAGGGVARPAWTSRFSTDSVVVELRLHERPTGMSAGDCGVIDIRSPSASIARMEIDDATGRVYVYAATGGSIFDSAATLVPTGAGSRLSLGVQVSTGTVQARLYTASDGDGATPAWSDGLTGQALGASNATVVRLGQTNSGPAGTARLEHVRVDDTTFAPLGPWTDPSGTPPMTATATMPAPSVDAGSTVTGGAPMSAQAVLLAPSVPSASGPTLTLDVPAVPADTAPQVAVTVSGLHPSSPSVVTVRRSVDGQRWDAVRGLAGRDVVSTAFVRDHEAPLNVTVTYQLEVDGALAAQGTVVVTAARAWVQDPLNPHTAVPVSTAAPDGVAAVRGTGASATFAQTVDLVTPAGSDLPVGSVGTRTRAARVPLLLDCDAQDSAALRRLLLSSGPLLVRGLPPWVPLDASATVVTDTVTLALVGLTRHRWAAEVTQVAPSSLRVAVPWWSWRRLMDAWPGGKWADLMAARPGLAFLDWMRDPEG